MFGGKVAKSRHFENLCSLRARALARGQEDPWENEADFKIWAEKWSRWCGEKWYKAGTVGSHVTEMGQELGKRVTGSTGCTKIFIKWIASFDKSLPKSDYTLEW